MHGWSLRQEQAELSRLSRAFIISIALHALVFGGYYAGQKLGVWQNFEWPAWLKPVEKLAEILKKKESPPPPPQETPLLFVEVTPEQAVPDPPKDAKYYATMNSKAANLEADKNVDVPKITGNQSQVVRTEDVPREKFTPLQPTPPAPPKEEEQPEQKAKPTQPVGDLALAKPDETPKKDEGEAKLPKPKTVKEALARKQNRRLAGERMKEDGGVQRKGQSSVDARMTGYAEYDNALIQAVQDRWYGLLDQREYASDSRGRVVLQFVLHYDGRVSDMAVAENTAGEVLGLICRKAVEDNSPFASWPSDMRRMLGDARHIQFTFYYN
jgi:outer membrane biosynthesis protein TonB